LETIILEINLTGKCDRICWNGLPHSQN